MSKAPFLTLVFKGGRFENNGGMPVEALPELVAYRELVVAVARALWQENNPGRQRLPKGFEKSFKLQLERIGAGSVVPEVVREISPAPPPGEDFFSTARDIVESTVKSIAAGQGLPTAFPRQALARFSAFGQSLSQTEDEHVLLGPPNSEAVTRYDRAIRTRLLLAEEQEFADAVSLLGSVSAADRDAEGFDLRLEDGSKVQVHAPIAFFPVIVQALAKPETQVRVRGLGLFDRTARLLRVTSAADVSLAEEGEVSSGKVGNCATPIETQLEALRALGAGWFEHDSLPLSLEGIEWLEQLLPSLVGAFRLSTPFLYPTPSGAVRAEWAAAQWDVVAEFDLTGHAAEVFASRVNAEDIHETRYRAEISGAEAQLGRFLAEHLQ